MVILSGGRAVLQAALLDGVSLDRFSFQQNGPASPEVDVGRRQIVEALVVSAVIVVLDEGGDLPLEITLQEVVLQQDAVLEGLMPALDLALGLGMARRTTGMFHVPVGEPVSQAAGDVTRPIVREQPRT